MALMTAPLASLRRLRRMPLISPRLWLRRLVFWIGAVMVALVAIGFAWAANAATDVFMRVQAPRPWIAFIICPAGIVVCFLLTRYVFPRERRAAAFRRRSRRCT